MPKSTTLWKKGRGKLGLFEPLLGSWQAESQSPQGPGSAETVRCTRRFRRVLDGAYVELEARWELPGKVYEEIAIFGAHEGRIVFWSFTSDGKRSEGQLADGSDLHPEAIAFEAQMPAGLARMAYWPAVDGGFHWVVESKTKKGWNRFVEHHYRAV